MPHKYLPLKVNADRFIPSEADLPVLIYVMVSHKLGVPFSHPVIECNSEL